MAIKTNNKKTYCIWKPTKSSEGHKAQNSKLKVKKKCDIKTESDFKK